MISSWPAALPAIHSRPLRLRSREGHEPGRKVTWLELFFDLVFVAAVSQVGAPLAEDFSAAGLVRFSFLFALIWWAWYGHTNYSTRFDADDGPQRILTLLQMFAAAAMCVNARGPLYSEDTAGFVAAYAVMRFILVGQYARVRHLPEAQALTRAQMLGVGGAAAVWLLSALAPVPWRFVLWALAIGIDLGTPILTSRLVVEAPPDAEHLPERVGLFTIILIGDAMVGVMRGMETQANWPLDAAASAFLGMVVVFLTWWWYFDSAEVVRAKHVRTERDVYRLHAWTFLHLPLYIGIVITGVGIHHTVAVAARGHLHAAESWSLCGAVALVMSSIGAMGWGSRRAVWLSVGLVFLLGAAGPFLPCALVMAALVALLAGPVVEKGAGSLLGSKK